MIERTDTNLMSHLFLLDVQVAEGGPTPDAIENHLRDALYYMEKVGEIETNYLGLTEVEGEVGSDVSV